MRVEKMNRQHHSLQEFVNQCSDKFKISGYGDVYLRGTSLLDRIKPIKVATIHHGDTSETFYVTIYPDGELYEYDIEFLCTLYSKYNEFSKILIAFIEPIPVNCDAVKKMEG